MAKNKRKPQYGIYCYIEKHNKRFCNLIGCPKYALCHKFRFEDGKIIKKGDGYYRYANGTVIKRRGSGLDRAEVTA